MKLKITEDLPTHVQVTIEGNITQKELAILADPLGEVLGPEMYWRPCLFDLSSAQYVDSSGIGWLLGCHKRFRTNGSKLVLHSLQPLVANTLKMLKLGSIFNLAPDHQTALESTREATV